MGDIVRRLAVATAAALGAHALVALGTALTLLILALPRHVDLTRLQQDARTCEPESNLPDWVEKAVEACLSDDGLSVSLLALSWSEESATAT